MSMTKRGTAIFLAIAVFLSCCGGTGMVANAADAMDDYDKMRLRFYDMAIGKGYDTSEEWTQPIIKSINDTAQARWNSMNKNPVSQAVNGSYRDANDNIIPGADSSKDYLWADSPLGKRGTTGGCWYESNNIQWSYIYLRSMAVAYQTAGADLYHNQALKADIKSGLKYMYDNHFNPNVKNYGNWYAWELGAGLNFGELMIMMYDELTETEIKNYAAMLVHYLGKKVMTGANGMWAERVRMYAGILLKEKSWLDFVKAQTPGYLKYTASSDGYYTDGTFIQHENLPYNNGYGISCLTDSAFLLHMLSGTQWQLSADNSNIIYQWIYDSYETVVYDGLAMDAFRGREITRETSSQGSGGISIANTALMLAEMAPAAVKKDFLGMVKQWFSNSHMQELLVATAGSGYFSAFNTVVKVNEILADDSIEPRKLVGNFQMNAGARAIHHTEDFAYSISMTSRRIATYEGGDSNVRGWYIANGMTHLYNGDMGRYDGVIKCTMDWYRLPGATAVYGKSQAATTNLKSFVGGTALNKIYGITGMDFEVAANNLKMKKSWFQFADAIVALGSGISGTGQVETTLENYVLAENNRTYSVDGIKKTMTMNGLTSSVTGASTLHINGNAAASDIGFYFPEGADLSLTSGTRTGKYTDFGASNKNDTLQKADFFTVWQSHGNNPVDAGYSYVLLPGKTDIETRSYAEANTIEILQKDEKAHAVYEKGLDVLGVHFWQDGSNVLSAKGVDSYLCSDKAASIMVGEDNNGIDISIADSTQENAGYINVTVNREAAGVVEADEGVEVLQTAPVIKLRVNVKDSKGKNFSVRLSYEEIQPAATEILSADMADDALAVNLKPVAGAAYEVRYGTESGKYTERVTGNHTKINVYGLTPGATYYLTAAARVGDRESAPAAEYTITIPASTRFVDEFENMGKMLQYSGGWTISNSNPGTYGGDADRIARKANTTEYFSYMLPGLKDFSLVVYGYNKSIGTIKLYTSSDGVNWTPQTWKDEGDEPQGQWYRRVITPSGAINANADYFKVELSSHSSGWAPHFARFEATLRNSSDRKLLKDSLLNDSRIYDTKNIRFTQNNAPGLFGGDSDIVLPAAESNEILYSWTGITDATLRAYVKSGGAVTAFASSDGKQYSAAALTSLPGDTDAAGYRAVNLTAENLPAGTNYLKLCLNGDAALGETILEYRPSNLTVQQIRFADAAIDGVIAYDMTPAVKTTPMNGIGTLVYSTINDDVAAFNNDTLSFLTQGTTKAVVTVEGTHVTGEVPLTVYKNLALRRPVTVSGSASLYPAANAVDGKETTGWQSAGSGGEWIVVDLGAGAVFDAVDISWTMHGTDYIIELSDDGLQYTTLKQVSGATSSREYVRFDFDTQKTGRYLRVQTVTPSQLSLSELRALQKTGADAIEPWNLALNQKATASSVDSRDPQMTPNLAVDGNTGTRWGSERTDNQWFVVDLGETATVEGVNILWETAYGKEYKLQVSDDNNTWRDMLHEQNGSAGWKRYTFPEEHTGRYVRMFGIKRGTSYGYSIFEFKVMGVSASGSQPSPVTQISFGQAGLSLLKGQTYDLIAKTNPVVSPVSIGWKTSDSDIISVNKNGRITVRGNTGSAVITAYSVLNPNIKAECTVTVASFSGKPVPVTGIAITDAPENGGLAPGDTFTMKAAVTPNTATNKTVVWKSSNPSAAVINAAGTMQVVGYGEAVITARSVASGQTDMIALNIAESSVLPGDVDGNEEVSAADVVALRRLIVSGNEPTAEQLAAGDLNEDGSLTSEDVTVLLDQLGILPGDVDNNKQVAALDIMLIRRQMLSENPPSDHMLAAGDLDGDGQLKAVDIMKLRKLMLERT